MKEKKKIVKKFVKRGTKNVYINIYIYIRIRITYKKNRYYIFLCSGTIANNEILGRVIETTL